MNAVTGIRAPVGLLLLALLAGCAGPAPYRYRYVKGKTATLAGGYATAPPKAPAAVVRAIEAGNRIAGAHYAYGGGHGGQTGAFDCSGAVSYVLREAGLLRGSMTSRGFRKYGENGAGRWITLYARKDHVYLVIAGLRFDTGWSEGPKGPKWTTRGRPNRGAIVRHPKGL